MIKKEGKNYALKKTFGVKQTKITNKKKKIDPVKEALKIIFSYILLGFLWVLLSDKVLSALVKDIDILNVLQLYKGWFYVGMTAVVFYIIILDKLKLFDRALDKSREAYEKLKISHEELISLETELKDRNERLNKSQTELIASNRRFELVVDGANDGIWDWDVIHKKYFFSICFKKEFGYSSHDIDSSSGAWMDMIHPSDVPHVMDTLEEYMKTRSGIYQNTYRIKAKDGEYRWVLSRGKGEWDENGVVCLAGSHTDITEQKIMEKKLYNLAYYDSLTGLPNKSNLKEVSANIIQNARNKDFVAALLYIDIDDFKNINETMGHDFGDQLIIHIADILKTLIKEPHFVASLGGDEFAILLLNLNHSELVQNIRNIIRQVRQPWIVSGHSFFTTVSIGVALYPDHGSDFSTLFQNSDIALSNVKEKGKDAFSFFTQELSDRAWNYIEMDNQIRKALEKQEFSLFYQPQWDLRNNNIVAVEALIRWNHTKKGNIPPTEFIAFAEKTGHIGKISRWVFENACMQKQIWNGDTQTPFKLAINLSGEVLLYRDLAKDIKELMHQYNIKENELEVELTETALLEDFNNSIQILNELKQLGISIALDDFGTGYSSLTYLKDLPIDVIKIDRKFLKGVGRSEKDTDILKYMIELAHSLKLQVVAEGVETKQQLDWLKENNCDIGQGFYLYKPNTAQEVEKLFK